MSISSKRAKQIRCSDSICSTVRKGRKANENIPVQRWKRGKRGTSISFSSCRNYGACLTVHSVLGLGLSAISSVCQRAQLECDVAVVSVSALVLALPLSLSPSLPPSLIASLMINGHWDWRCDNETARALALSLSLFLSVCVCVSLPLH